MAEIQFTNAARQDLKRIFTYRIRRWGRRQAGRYSVQLNLQIQKIAQDAVFSKPVQNTRSNLRQSTAGRHLIIFEQTDEQILIVRILHEAMDIPCQIGPPH